VLLAALAIGAIAAVLLGGGDDEEQGATTIVRTVVAQGTTTTVTTTTEPVTTDTAEQELASFVDTLEALLAQSSSSRAQAVELVGIVSSSCTSDNAARAALDMERVAGSRQQTLDGLNAVSAPTPSAIRAVARLRAALRHSIDANQRYVGWMNALADSGCAETPVSRDFFDAADDASARATAAKKRFVSAFNPLARRVGRQTWTHDRI
jgi:hypothetical protein